MTSEKQIEANRRNAQLSTGPKTEAGKAIVSQNALKHGLRAGAITFDPNDEYIQPIRDELAAEWNPQTFTEWNFIEQMAVALHKMSVIEELESDWQSPMATHKFGRTVQIIWRRQASLERSYDRAYNNLMKYRKFRAAEQKSAAKVEPKPAEPIPAPEPEPVASPEPLAAAPQPEPAAPRHPQPVPAPQPSAAPELPTLDRPDPPDELAPRA